MWKMRFDFVGPPVAHWSIEGYPADGSGPIFGLLGSKWGDKVLDQSHQSFTARAAHLHSCMWTDGKGYADEYDPGSKLNPSGEHRYEVWLDVDDATVDVVVSAIWYPTVDVSPVSTDIGGGASVICSMDGGSYGYYGACIVNGERKESQPPFTNPDTWTGAADGSVKVGEIEAGIAYIDHGGNPGQAASHLSVFFDVEPD